MSKVCHITTVHTPFDNRIFHKECKSLSENGYDVTLLVAGHDTSSEVDKVKLVNFPKSKNRFIRMISTSLFQVFNQALKVDADLYHFHDPELIFVGLLLKIKGRKVIYDAHENVSAAILSKYYLKPNALRKLIALTFDLIEKSISKSFDGVITARPDITETFKVRKIETIRNFPIVTNVRMGQCNIEINKGKKVIIYVGGMTYIRGIKELVDSFTSLDDYELWLLGPFSQKELYEDCKNSPGWKNTRYLGKVSVEEVFAYTRMADAGIITFWPEPNHVKTLATKPFEYMACGLPMIMSNFPYWRDFFGSSSLYVDPKNSDEIAKTIIRLFENEDLMKQMSKLNLELIDKEYSWEAESKKLVSFYQNILQPAK